MKTVLLLLCLLLTGCSYATQTPESTTATSPMLQLGNPWKDYTTLEEAEAACGLDFPLEDTVASSYKAETYRVLNDALLEVTYRDHEYEVTVRMQAEEGLDLSGVYEEFKSITTFDRDNHSITTKEIKDGGLVQLVSTDGCSYSFYAPNHYWGDSNTDFLAFLNQ